MKNVRLLLLIIIVGFSTIETTAQTIDQVTFSPNPLTECQAIDVTIDGWQPMPQFFIDSTVYNVSGNQVNITIHWNAPPFGNPMIAPYSESITIPANTLNDGTYTFNVQCYFVLTNSITATSSNVVTVGSCCSAVADFAIANPQVCEGQPLAIQDLSSGYDSLTWLLDGQVYSTTPGDFNIGGLATGQYQLQLITTSATCSDTASAQFTVNALPPANFNTSQLGNNFSFTASGLASNNYYWDFGDGTVDSGQVITHLYEMGSYEVCLTVENLSGCTSTVCDSVIYSNIGLDSWEKPGLHIYPNPANEYIYIKNAAEDPIWYDARGRELELRAVQSTVGAAGRNYYYDLSGIPPGSYIVRSGESSQTIILR